MHYYKDQDKRPLFPLFSCKSTSKKYNYQLFCDNQLIRWRKTPYKCLDRIRSTNQERLPYMNVFHLDRDSNPSAEGEIVLKLIQK